ncbi:MAG: hypothetical protein HY290_06425 [Planctomycetia bacterium]|nr:hypothetical protein [Planctomycetia bacterium]
MQVTRFLDGGQDFPSELTDEEGVFVDRLIAVQEMLLADAPHHARVVEAIHRAVPAAAGQLAEPGATGQRQHPPVAGGPVENRAERATSQDDEATETSDDGAETIDDHNRSGGTS